MKRPKPMPLPPHIQRRSAGACLRLPTLTAEEAWTVAAILEGFLDSIWRVHGDAMADYQGRVFPDLPAPPDACSCTPDLGLPDATASREPF